MTLYYKPKLFSGEEAPFEHRYRTIELDGIECYIPDNCILVLPPQDTQNDVTIYVNGEKLSTNKPTMMALSVVLGKIGMSKIPYRTKSDYKADADRYTECDMYSVFRRIKLNSTKLTRRSYIINVSDYGVITRKENTEFDNLAAFTIDKAADDKNAIVRINEYGDKVFMAGIPEVYTRYTVINNLLYILRAKRIMEPNAYGGDNEDSQLYFSIYDPISNKIFDSTNLSQRLGKYTSSLFNLCGLTIHRKKHVDYYICVYYANLSRFLQYKITDRKKGEWKLVPTDISINAIVQSGNDTILIGNSTINILEMGKIGNTEKLTNLPEEMDLIQNGRLLDAVANERYIIILYVSHLTDNGSYKHQYMLFSYDRQKDNWVNRDIQYAASIGYDNTGYLTDIENSFFIRDVNSVHTIDPSTLQLTDNTLSPERVYIVLRVK